MLKQLRCPSCGAQLDPPGVSATEVTCAYCGVTAALESRTQGEGAKAPPPGMPVAQYKLPRWAYIFYVLPFAGAIVGIGATIFGAVTAGVPGLGAVLQWSSNTPFELRDVNGDGELDVVGRVNAFAGGDQIVHFAAFDGRSGNELWRTAPLGKFAEEHSAKGRALGDVVVFGDSHGQLHAFALADGQPRWKATLGEQVAAMCPGDEGAAIVVTADEVARVVTLADGSFRPGEAPPDCATPPQTPGTYGIGEQRSSDADASAALEPPSGMALRRSFTAPEGLQIALGVKDPGTAVPMLAVYRDGELQWSSPASAGDPLAAEPRDATLALLRGATLIATSAPKDDDQRVRLVARDIARGAVLWDVEIPHSEEVSSGPTRMAVSDDRVFVAHWTWLEAFDRETGEHLYTVGRWR